MPRPSEKVEQRWNIAPVLSAEQSKNGPNPTPNVGFKDGTICVQPTKVRRRIREESYAANLQPQLFLDRIGQGRSNRQPQSSSLGIDTYCRGATLDFAITNAVVTVPSSSSNRR